MVAGALSRAQTDKSQHNEQARQLIDPLKLNEATLARIAENSTLVAMERTERSLYARFHQAPKVSYDHSHEARNATPQQDWHEVKQILGL